MTELVYRHQIRPVIQTSATVMDGLFADKGRNGRGVWLLSSPPELVAPTRTCL